jgi:hypothetical protein
MGLSGAQAPLATLDGGPTQAARCKTCDLSAAKKSEPIMQRGEGRLTRAGRRFGFTKRDAAWPDQGFIAPVALV